MGDINVVSEEEKIIVGASFSSINVGNLPRSEEFLSVSPIEDLLNSYPATIDTGIISGNGAVELPILNTRIPTKFKKGDHLRIFYHGTLGDYSSSCPWWHKVWINGIKTTDNYISSNESTSGGKRVPFKDEIDIMMDAKGSAWIYQRSITGSVLNTLGTGESAAAGCATDGPVQYRQFDSYAHILQNLPGAGLMVSILPASTNTSSVRIRSITVEHLIAP